MKAGLGSIMKQAQKMQEGLLKAQEELAEMEVEGEAGGGLVKIRITGKHEVRQVQIDESLMGDDREMLEDLVAAAMNDAVNRAEQMSQEKMKSLTAGMALPTGMKMPF